MCVGCVGYMRVEGGWWRRWGVCGGGGGGREGGKGLEYVFCFILE